MEQLLIVLRRLVAILKPFSVSVTAGARVWNGSAFASAARRDPEPYALAWTVGLSQIIAMLEGQGVDITVDQIDHLKKQLLGGMGSLADFRLDTHRFGEEAKAANAKLDADSDQLFGILSDLEHAARKRER